IWEAVMKTVLVGVVVLMTIPLSAQRLMEHLDRGLVAVKTSDNSTFISWRLLATDEYNLPFHLYRQYGKGKKIRLTDQPLTKGTNFEDKQVDLANDVTYTLVSLQNQQE